MDKVNQQTLVLIKPDAIKRGLVGEIIARFERLGLEIVKCKLVVPDREFAEKHYPVTDDWLITVGNRTIEDCKKYGVTAKEALGEEDPKRIGHLIHKWNVDFFTGERILALVLTGAHAIEAVRKIVGSTIPLTAVPGTIRGDFSSASAFSENSQQHTIYTLVHASGAPDEAEREINLWFGEE